MSAPDVFARLHGAIRSEADGKQQPRFFHFSPDKIQPAATRKAQT